MDVDEEVQPASLPEHNYSKVARLPVSLGTCITHNPFVHHNFTFQVLSTGSESGVGEESMDTNSGSRLGEEGSPLITTLDEQADTFESFLLCLLRAFTKQQQLVITGGPTQVAGQRTETVEITPEALSTLSSDQVTTLVTSNSVNFDVVQQILTQKQRQHPSKSESAPPEAGSLEQAVPTLPTTLGVVTGGGDLAGGGADITPAFQITPEQLKQLQLHVSEMIRSQQISLPPDLTPEQQQQLIRTLLLQQLQAAQGVTTEATEGDRENGGGDKLLKGNGGEGGESEGKDTGVRSDPIPMAAEGPSQAVPETNISKEVHALSTLYYVCVSCM